MRGLRFGLAVAAFLFAGVLPASAQQGTAEIGGKITDSQGGVLPGVAIVAINEDTGIFRETVSGAGGSYSIPQMIPGRYQPPIHRSIQVSGRQKQCRTAPGVHLES